MDSDDKTLNQPGGSGENYDKDAMSPWRHLTRGMWRTPWGLLGVVVTVTSMTLMAVGLVGDMLSLIENPYAGIFIYMILPATATMGFGIIILAAFLRRRQWYKFGIEKIPLVVDLSDKKHRVWVIRFIILSVVTIITFGVIGYEGYHFTDSPYFCGMICHKVMEPEYMVYQRSNHSRVYCVECHIGSGAKWFVKAKLSGLRQVVAAFTESYNRPIPAPVDHLRPARDICEECHWPDKFLGKKVKTFVHFDNDNQTDPEVNEIALHVGGHNDKTGEFEGIHWHVSKDNEVSYLAIDRERTKIAKVRVKRADGSTEEYTQSDIEIPEGEEFEWRVMDCIDCHNRPTHTYDMPEERVDFGLQTMKINPEIPGIREDSLKAITREYASRDEAETTMIKYLLELQTARHPELVKEKEEDIIQAGNFLLETYLGNVWPQMNVFWGTYKQHLGHQYEEEGIGCFRCHNDEHENENGDTISQDCTLCHDDPY